MRHDIVWAHLVVDSVSNNSFRKLTSEASEGIEERKDGAGAYMANYILLLSLASQTLVLQTP
jgi:hypothetical protein